MVDINELRSIVDQYKTADELGPTSSFESSQAPEDQFTYHQISEDPSAPIIRIPKSFTQEQRESYLQSPKLSAELFSKGFLYQPGVDKNVRAPAIKVEAPTMDDRGDFMRNVESAMSIYPTIVQSAKNIFGDIFNNEEMMENSQRAINLYQQQTAAKRFFTTEEGEVKPYGQTLEEIFQDEDKLSAFIDWGQGALGNAVVSWLPMIVLGGVAGLAGGVPLAIGSLGFAGFSYGIGEIRPAQLENMDDPNTANTLLGATVYGTAEAVLGGPGRILRKVLTKKYGKETADSILKRFGKGAAEAAPAEGLTEVIQETVTQAVPEWDKANTVGEAIDLTKQKLSDPEVQKQIREAGYQGTFAGGVLGGGTNVVLGNRNRDAYEAHKKNFKAQIDLGEISNKDPDIQDFQGKTVTVKDISIMRDADDNIIKDKTDRAVEPTYTVVGTKTIDGEKHAVLLSTRGGVKNPVHIVPMKDVPNVLNEYAEPVEVAKSEEIKVEEDAPQVGDVYLDRRGDPVVVKSVSEENGVLYDEATLVNPVTGEPQFKQGMSQYNDFIKTFKKQDPKKVKSKKVTFGSPEQIANLEKEIKNINNLIAKEKDPAAKLILQENRLELRRELQRLKQTQYTTETTIDETNKTAEEVQEYVKHNTNTVKAAKKRLTERGFKDVKKLTDDDAVVLAEDNLNEISGKEREELTKLGYFNGQNGEAKIQSLEEDIKLTDTKDKTRGRAEIERIIKDKISFEPMKVTQNVQVGETRVPPLTKEQLKQQGYSVKDFDYKATDFERDIRAIDLELRQAQTPEQINAINERKRYLRSLYRIATQPIDLRYQELIRAIQNRPLNYINKQLLDGSFFNTQQLPSLLRGLEQQIEITQNRTNISPEDKSQALSYFNEQLESLKQFKSDMDTLQLSLGVDEVIPLDEYLTLSRSTKGISKIVKDIKGTIQKKYEKETTAFWSAKNNNPRLQVEFIEDLPAIEQKLKTELERLGLTGVDLKVLEDYFVNKKSTNGAYLVHLNVLDIADRMKGIAMKLAGGMNFDKALLTTPHSIPQNKIIVSAAAENPIAFELKQDPRMYTLHHEVMHLLFNNGFFTANEVKVLKNAAQNYWLKQYDIAGYKTYAKESKEIQIEEAISEAFAAYMANKYQPRGVIASLFYRLKAFLNGLSNALFSTGYTSPESIFNAIDLGKIQNRKFNRESTDLVDVAYKNSAYLSDTSQSNFDKFFSGSKVKGGTDEGTLGVGPSITNVYLNTLYNSPFYTNTRTRILNRLNERAATLESLDLVPLVDRLFSYYNLLTGSENGTGIPTTSNLVEMNKLVAEMRELAQKADITNMTPDKFVGTTTELNFIERLETASITPLQKITLRSIAAIVNMNNPGLLPQNDTELKTARDTLVNELNYIFANKLANTHLTQANSPLIVFHGTDRDFEEFSKYRDFFFHFGSQTAAIARADYITKNYNSFRRSDNDSKIMPFFLNLKNPLLMRDLGSWDARSILRSLTNDKDPKGARLFRDKGTGLTFHTIKNDMGKAGSVIYGDTIDVLNQLIFTPEEAKNIEAQMDVVYNRLMDQRAKTEAESTRLEDPYESYLKTEKLKNDVGARINTESDKIIVKAIKDKGYDGIAYLNSTEMGSLDIAPQYSYIAFDATQIKHATENSGDYDVSSPKFRRSDKYEQDPSEIDQDQPPTYTRQKFRQQEKSMDKLIKDDDKLLDQNDRADEETKTKRFGNFNRIMSHARIWAQQFPIFTPLFNIVRSKQEFVNTLNTRAVDKLTENFIPLMRDPEASKLLMKAMEISQQVPGRYRPNELGDIIFVARENGRGAGSTVKAGETITLTGQAAAAYLDVQEQIQLQHKEIIRGMLANENVSNIIKEAIAILRNNRKDLLDNPILNLTSDQLESLEYNDLRFIVNELQNTSTYLQPSGLYSRDLFNKVSSIISKTKVKRDAVGNPVSADKTSAGLSGILQELGQYNRFKQNDYIPLQRYGNFFIAVKNESGNLLEYRMFNKGKFGTKFLDEERDVRQQLREKYPDINIDAIQTEAVTINNLRRSVNADLQTLDSISQFLSDINANHYVELRKELNTLVNKKFGADIRGYSIFLKPRKEQAGVAGFSTDFGRAISQYISTSSEFAGQNRYKSTEIRLKNNIENQSKNETLKRAVDSWYGYTDDPKQEWAKLRRAGFWWFLGGNISSALLQTVTILQFSGPFLSEFSNTPRVLKELTRATNDVRKMMIFKNRKFQDVFMNFDDAPTDIQGMKEDYIKDVQSGLIKQGAALKEAAMPTDTASYRSRSRARNALRILENTIMGGLFNTFETMSRSSVYFATYRLAQDIKFREKIADFLSNDENFQLNVRLNKGEVTPRIIAQHLIDETFGLYGKINRPTWAKGLGSVVFLFNTYISQMFSLMGRMLTHRGGQRKLVGQRILAKQLAMIMATGGIFALPFADDATWLAEFIYNIFTGMRTNVRQEYRRFMDEHGFDAGLIEGFENGLVNKLFDADLSRRVRFNVPGGTQLKAILDIGGLASGGRVEELGGAVGTMIFGNARGIVNDIAEEGELNSELFNKIFKRTTPTFIKNFSASLDYLNGGPILSSKGTLLIDDPTLYQAFMKSIGFNPTEISKKQDLLYLEKVNGGVTSGARKRFNNRITNSFRRYLVAIREGDTEEQIEQQEKLAEIMGDLVKFNYNLSQTKPGLVYTPDTWTLFKEAVKDISTEYRISQGSAYEIYSNLFDYQAAGYPLFSKPN